MVVRKEKKMWRKAQNEKGKEREAKQDYPITLELHSLSKNNLTRENNDFCQMSSKENWLCSLWKLWMARRLGSLEIKTTSANVTRWSSILLPFPFPSSSIRHTHQSRPKTSAYISFLLFCEFLLLLVLHRSSLKCFFM